MTTRWNAEIAGIVALGVAVLLALALLLPPAHTGLLGARTASGMHVLFGMAAGWFPLLFALLATIVFLEINVPRMMATYGGASCAYFLIVAAMYGTNGGWLGRTLDAGLRALFGDVGAVIVLIVAALGVTVWITNVSLKKVIGWIALRVAALRPPAAPKLQLPALRSRAPALAVAAPARAPVAPAYDVDDVDDEDEEDDDEEEDEEDEDDDDRRGRRRRRRETKKTRNATTRQRSRRP